MAQLLADGGLEAIERSGEVQEAVDVAVEIVDVCLKVGSAATLDRALERIDPEAMPRSSRSMRCR